MCMINIVQIVAFNTSLNSVRNTVHHHFLFFHELKTNYVGLSSEHSHNEIVQAIVSASCKLELLKHTYLFDITDLFKMYVLRGKGFNSKYQCFLFQEIELNWNNLVSYELSKVQSFWDKMKVAFCKCTFQSQFFCI